MESGPNHEEATMAIQKDYVYKEKGNKSLYDENVTGSGFPLRIFSILQLSLKLSERKLNFLCLSI